MGAARRLVLLRHAKAETPASLSDEMRPLALRGRRQCADVAAYLRTAGLVPDAVLVSSALRTRQTWELVCSALGDDVPAQVEVTDRLYLAGVRELLELVRQVDAGVGTLLVVGHEPTVSATASGLAGQGEPEHLAQVRTGLSTAAAAVLETDVPWADLGAGGARLLDVSRPQH
ncbi:phosphohistidine phosphatase [Actinotalea ferrariae CF5-4]|uniref:Phosphohistidine phosphatase n=1 Tax=Actinotalea ferrariae CF5-4 TaxID=948458 RepID=A0A021VVE0_9CELL|nr:histidine phosphatase family protein [Actinotalea ferrariae]EYR63037.1 phosphohistidine phosphatase [Actinotalea ferrariae CF5-4]